MENALLESLHRQEAKYSFAVSQLGSYQALLDYAISCLEGKTACSQSEVASYIARRHNEILTEQQIKLFNRQKQ
jgi:hypothetical protein